MKQIKNMRKTELIIYKEKNVEPFFVTIKYDVEKDKRIQVESFISKHIGKIIDWDYLEP